MSLCESELAVLLCYEGKLVAALKKEDVMSLCQNLCERVVISKEVKDKFASLDHDNLKMELMVRYLLQYAGADLGGGAEGARAPPPPPPPWTHTFHNACAHLLAQYAS